MPPDRRETSLRKDGSRVLRVALSWRPHRLSAHLDQPQDWRVRRRGKTGLVREQDNGPFTEEVVQTKTETRLDLPRRQSRTVSECFVPIVEVVSDSTRRVPTCARSNDSLESETCLFSVVVASTSPLKMLLFLMFCRPFRGIGMGFFCAIALLTRAINSAPRPNALFSFATASLLQDILRWYRGRICRRHVGLFLTSYVTQHLSVSQRRGLSPRKKRR